jgi:hypothetical protein
VSIAPEPIGAVFENTPVLLFGEASGTDTVLELSWDSGKLSLQVPQGDASIGKTLRLLQGSRLITDWESRYPAGEALATIEKRQQSRVAGRLRSLSETYGLASREMALVAVVKRASDIAGELPVTRVVPVGLPKGMQFGAIFGDRLSLGSPAYRFLATPPRVAAGPGRGAARSAPGAGRGDFRAILSKAFKPRVENKTETVEDILIELASQLEPDGGMPGENQTQRATRTIAVLYAMISHGHTARAGAFRSHVARLVDFLQRLKHLDAGERVIVERVLKASSTGHAGAGDWLKIAQRKAVSWDEIAGEP